MSRPLALPVRIGWAVVTIAAFGWGLWSLVTIY